MCGGVHFGEVEGLVAVERWSCSRGVSCVVEYTLGRLRDCVLAGVACSARKSSPCVSSGRQSCHVWISPAFLGWLEYRL